MKRDLWRLGRLMLAAAVLSTAACAKSRSGGVDEPAPEDSYGPTTVLVDNTDYKDYRIYLESETGLRVRLGDAPGNTVTELKVPDSFAVTGAQVRFLALPLATRNAPSTQNIVLRRGDQITIRITP